MLSWQYRADSSPPRLSTPGRVALGGDAEGVRPPSSVAVAVLSTGDGGVAQAGATLRRLLSNSTLRALKASTVGAAGRSRRLPIRQRRKEASASYAKSRSAALRVPALTALDSERNVLRRQGSTSGSSPESSSTQKPSRGRTLRRWMSMATSAIPEIARLSPWGTRSFPALSARHDGGQGRSHSGLSQL